MQQLRIFLIILSLILTNVIYGQVDPQLCPSGPITNPDPNWRPIPYRFEIMTELISGNEMMELSQAFSNIRDAVTMNSRVGPLQFYWYFDTNEQFEVLTAIVNQQPVSVCLRQVIESTSKTSVIQSSTLFLKPSVLLGYDHRNQINPSWGNQYIGDEIIRSVPTNKFKSCFYVSDIGATVSATYYISDGTKFQANLPANESMILKIDVQIKNQTGHQEKYTYNVFRYTPHPSRREERQALETPEGVYCANRISTLPVPQNIPERVSSNSEAIIKQLNNSIISQHGLYDTVLRFSRFDVWYPDPLGGPSWLHHTEIHDFATGLSYQYNHTTRQCSIRDINTASFDTVTVDGKPNLVQMGSTEHLFLMDDITYQYTGEKQCRDRVRCRVWIGEKSLPNNTIQHREWYWASTINDVYLETSFPVKMNFKTYVNDVPTIEFETTIFNFRRNPNTAFEIDYTMAECYRAMGPEEKFNLGVISFTIANDNEYPVHKNIDYLRYTIWQTLANVLRVRSIRISNILVDHDGKDLPVTFTLLDSPPRLGPVESPLQEPSLTTAIEHLRTMIDANGLSFRAKYNTTEITLRARIRSLQVIHTSLDQNTTQCVNKTQNPNECPSTTTVQNQDLNQNIEIVYKGSGPLITGFWIGFIILGVLIGTVGGFFVLKRFFGR